VLIASLLLIVSADLTVEVSSTEVQIGEPIVCTVALEGSRAALSEEALEPGRSWVILKAPSIRRSPEGDEVLTWTVIGLEPDTGPLPVPILLQDGARVPLAMPEVEVGGELTAGEDELRPSRSFLVPESVALTESSALWMFAQAGFALIAIAVWLLSRWRTPQPLPEPSLSARLDALGRTVDGEDPGVVPLHAELTQILRAAYSEDQAGMSDEEWIERADLSVVEREELKGLFATCAAVKYGGARPTRFAVEETLALARELVSRVEEVAA